ncbi:MAG TPA: keto-hydroxyglutarate-aldolase/keto-deoxy-phosphogluconate aldolase, partial [Beijerinckiaceae bacterium]
AREAGAAFALSPGSTPALLEAARAMDDYPFVPGVATASELMTVMSQGFHIVKFFPAAALGPSALRAMGAAFPHARFMPTGSVAEEDLEDWLALPNVIAVGGAWLAPKAEIDARDFAAIGRRAEAAAQRARKLRA